MGSAEVTSQSGLSRVYFIAIRSELIYTVNETNQKIGVNRFLVAKSGD